MITTPGHEPGYPAAMTDTVHDPGPDAAAATFDGSSDVAANPLELKSGGTVRIGTASWTDPTMTASGVFYPSGADSAEERLQFYASRFPLVGQFPEHSHERTAGLERSVTQHGELLGGHLTAAFNLREVRPVIGDAVGQVVLV